MNSRHIRSCMALPLLLALQSAWADDAPGAPEPQVQQVIKLPLRPGIRREFAQAGQARGGWQKDGCGQGRRQG